MGALGNSSHDSGIGVIDAQHQELFQIVEQLRQVVQEGAARNRVEALLGELVACSERHFATEEACMGKFHYPDFEQHVVEHRTMLASLQDLNTMFLENPQAMVMLVPTFIEGWLRHHISDGDFGFITFLKAHHLV